MTTDVPSAHIAPQAQTTPPFTNDATLVDDPTALVNDATALSAGPVTIVEEIKLDVELPKVTATIKRYR